MKKNSYSFAPKHKFERNGPKISFGSLIGYENSVWITCFANSKIFRLHAILHDAVESVKSTTNKGPGYCYVLPRFPSSCFLGHVTELLFCLDFKIFASTFYALFNC